MPCLGPMYGWCKKIFAALSNLTFSDTKAYFSTFPQKKERRCGGGLSISESNSERSSPSHFGLVWEILFVKERSHRIPNRPRPLWIGPFGNLEKIAHKLEGIHPEGAECQFCMQSVTLVSIFYRRQVLQVQAFQFSNTRASNVMGRRLDLIKTNVLPPPAASRRF